MFSKYKTAYRNWISVLIQLYSGSHYVRVKLKDKTFHEWNHSLVTSYPDLIRLGLKSDVIDYFDNKKNYFEFNYKKKIIRLYGPKDNKGDIANIFLDEDYKFLNSENGIIIDIGANIADSTIYFAVNGASRVIALEPYPYSYNYGVKNIHANLLEEKITLLNYGYGKGNEIKIEENKITGLSTSLTQSDNGEIIKLYTLKSLIDEFSLDGDLLLKIDCEGCEYNLLEESENVIKRFERIQIEYHYGYSKLKEKLEKYGFEVTVTKPFKSYNDKLDDPNRRVGFLYAKRN